MRRPAPVPRCATSTVPRAAPPMTPFPFPCILAHLRPRRLPVRHGQRETAGQLDPWQLPMPIVELARSWSSSWPPPPIQNEPVDWTIACYLLAVPVLHGGGGGVYAFLHSLHDADTNKSNSSTLGTVRAFWPEPVKETAEHAHVLSGIQVSISPPSSILHQVLRTRCSIPERRLSSEAAFDYPD